MQLRGASLPPTCRLLWHTGLWVAVRWLCTHFPKCCRQEESEGAQVWGHDGGFSSRQLEQEVCWQEPWHAVFSRDTNLQSREIQISVKYAAREDIKAKTSFFFFQSPGRADLRGVGLTVFLGALWVTALWIQGFNHCTKHILNKHWMRNRSGTLPHKALDMSNVIFTSFPEQQQKMNISNLTLRLIPYQ